jgi:DNA-binding LacI/PurR family transcriptional regulator
MSKKPTIHDVARQAGVCIGTVSRVINNKDKVLPATRKKILDIIAQTGYRPSPIARGLVLNRTQNILLCMHNIADPYCASVAKVIRTQSRKAGYGLLLGDSNYDHLTEADYLRAALDGRADGLLIAPLPGTSNATYYQDLVQAGFPMVAIDCQAPGVDLNCVKYDDVGIARLAADYLFDKGHRRIAFLEWQSEFQTVKDRYQGYLESHASHGAVVDPDYVVMAPKSLENWDKAVLGRLMSLPAPPSAILAENEIMASLCVNALLRLGKSVPRDVAVIGMGDVLSDAFFPLPMTVVAFHHEQAMRRALEMLLELIEHPDLRKEPPRQYVQQPELIVRESA